MSHDKFAYYRLPKEFASLYIMDVRRLAHEVFRKDEAIGKWIGENRKFFQQEAA